MVLMLLRKSSLQPGQSLCEDAEGVVREELNEIRNRRAALHGCSEDPRDGPKGSAVEDSLVGLALSGGGIRSASFSLGVVQALAESSGAAAPTSRAGAKSASGSVPGAEHESTVWSSIDYLSTVSGGGYTGSMLSSLLASGSSGNAAELPVTKHPGAVESPVLSHLRNGSEYLSNGSLLENLKLPMILLRGFLLNLLALTPAIILGALLVEFSYEKWPFLFRPQDGRAHYSWASALLWFLPFVALVVFYPLAGLLVRTFRPGSWKTRDWFEKGMALVLLMGLAVLLIVPVLSVLRWAIEWPWEGQGGVKDWWVKRERYAHLMNGATVAAAFAAAQTLLSLVSEKATAFRRVILYLLAFLVPMVPVAIFLFVCVAQVDSPYLYGDYREVFGALSAAEGESSKAKIGMPRNDFVKNCGLLFRDLDAKGLEKSTPLNDVKAACGELFDARAANMSKNWNSGEKTLLATHGLPKGGSDWMYRQFRRCGEGASTHWMTWVGSPGDGATSLEASKLEAAPAPVFKNAAGWQVFQPERGEDICDLDDGDEIRGIVRIQSEVGSPRQFELKGGKLRLGGEESSATVMRDRDFFALGLVLLVYVILFFNVNQSSLHGFYRDRLSRLFLLRLNEKTGEVEPNDCQKLSKLGPSWPQLASSAPYHLINATLNIQGSRNPKDRGRGASFYIFSKLFCGAEEIGYSRTRTLEDIDPHLNLGTAMAVSAAAAAPNMGAVDVGPLSAALTLLNLRLNYWLPNPRANIHDGPMRWWSRVPGPLYLLREATGSLDYRSRSLLQHVTFGLLGESKFAPFVNLSDGGHLENLGVYELLRRKCRLIIAVDSEADPEFRFDGLSTLMRHALIDLGATIEGLDVGKIGKPVEDGGVHHARATINYGTDGEGKAILGTFFYIKSSLTGDEPVYVQKYAAAAEHADFPHESTTDQFFDEAQFETYRGLGYHIGSEVVDELSVIVEAVRQGRVPKMVSGAEELAPRGDALSA